MQRWCTAMMAAFGLWAVACGSEADPGTGDEAPEEIDNGGLSDALGDGAGGDGRPGGGGGVPSEGPSGLPSEGPSGLPTDALDGPADFMGSGPESSDEGGTGVPGPSGGSGVPGETDLQDGSGFSDGGGAATGSGGSGAPSERPPVDDSPPSDGVTPNEAWCSEGCDRLQSCGLLRPVGGIFPVRPACMEACRSYSDGQRLAIASCFGGADDRAEERSLDACDLLPACFPEPEQLAPGSAAFCRQVEGTCGSLAAFSEDLVDVTIEECAWVFTGAGRQWEFDSFEDAAACVHGLDTCDELDILACMAPAHAPCDTMCNTINACPGVDVFVPDWDVENCKRLCYLGQLDDPEANEERIACVEDSTCFEMGDCF